MILRKIKKYHVVFSLGEDCSCSSYMKLARIRRTSGPFDWLTHATFEERFRLLINHFSDFLNKDDFVFLPKDPNVFNDENCDYYENKCTKFYFYHDFPVGVPFETSFPLVKEKYLRRIERFYNLIAQNKRVLFIWLSHDDNTNNDTIKELCDEFCSTIQKKCDFLIIEHDAKLKIPVKTEISSNITKYNLCTMEEGDDPTMGKIANVLPIFQNIKLKGYLKGYDVWGYYILYLLSKIICPLILYKPLKNKLKKKWMRRGPGASE